MIIRLVAAAAPDVSNNASFVFAAVALLVAAVSPLLLAFYNRRMSRKDRADDEERRNGERLRQDEVAIQAANVAAALIKSNSEVAAITQQAATETSARLAAIHTLVNSNLTQAQERELDATRAMLGAMREVMTMKQDRDLPVTPETIEAIKIIEARITIMAGDLAHKDQLTKLAERLLVEGIKSSLPKDH